MAKRMFGSGVNRDRRVFVITHRTCSGSPRTEKLPFSMTLANFVATKNASRLPFKALAAEDEWHKGQAPDHQVGADTLDLPLMQSFRS